MTEIGTLPGSYLKEFLPPPQPPTTTESAAQLTEKLNNEVSISVFLLNFILLI